jgi:hypothetical protein
MKMRKTVLTLGLLVGVGGLVQADAVKQAINVSLLSDTSLNGTAIPAGRYKIVWTEQNSEADVTVSSGGKVVAQAHAKVVEETDAPSSDIIVSRKDAKGTLALAEIRPKGKKTAIVLSQS